MDAVKITNLTKKYEPPRGIKRLLVKSPVRRTKLAVDNINLSIGRGELFGLIGPNGAGKTSLIKVLSTLLLPTSGKAEVCGHDVVRDEAKVKASIGFVSGEERSFYWRLTGRQNLLFFAVLHNLPTKVARKRIDGLLASFGLDSAADDMYYGYSRGMRQKLLLARGLLTDPQVLFLDEPTNSVDPVTGREIKRLIREKIVKEQGRTVLLTSHRLDEIEELCDRIAIMNHGKLSFVGSLDDLSRCMGRKSTLEELFIEHVQAEAG